MTANECAIRQTNIPDGPQARVLFFGAANAPKSEDMPALDSELKRYADEHDYRCGALASGADALDWMKENEACLVSLPGMPLNEWADIQRRLSPLAGIGIGDNKALANRPEVIAVNGVRLGFLSLSEMPYLGSGQCAAAADIEDLAVCDHIRMLLPQCDHVVVYCRAGIPGFDLPLPEWRNLYRRMIEAGASIVLGVAADEPLGWEEYGRGTVFYGLGMLAGDSLAVSVMFERNGRYSYESRLLQAGGGMISFSNDDEKKEAINSKNALLFNESAYMDAVDRACFDYYQAEGYSVLFGSNIKRGILSALLRKKPTDDQRDTETALKDLLANTSRRFAVLRALNGKERMKAGDTQ